MDPLTSCVGVKEACPQTYVDGAGALLLQGPLQLLHLTLLLHQTLVEEPEDRSHHQRHTWTRTRTEERLTPVLRLQLARPPVGVLQETLQQGHLLVVTTLLGQLQHLVLMLQTDQVFSGGQEAEHKWAVTETETPPPQVPHLRCGDLSSK